MNDQIIDNETGEVLDPRTMLTAAGAAIAADIDRQVATARQYPRRRDDDVSKEIIGRASLNESIASECNYSTKRGNKAITGPSIRFAEIVRASFGNIRVAARFVRIDAEDPERAAVIVEAIAHDMQTNNSETITIRRSIMTSAEGGRKPRMYNADMTNMTVNAAQSIARRNAILAVVPKALWITGYQQVINVLQGDGKTLNDRRERVMAAFDAAKVERASVFEALEVKDITDITLHHMPTLIGMLTAIKEGESPESVLGRMGTAEGAKHEVVKDPLRDTAAADTQPSQPAKPAVQPKAAAKPEPPKEEKHPTRAASEAWAAAEFVINAEGHVVKSRDGWPIEELHRHDYTRIIDQRFAEGDQSFDNMPEWIEETEAAKFAAPTLPPGAAKEPEPTTRKRRSAAGADPITSGPQPAQAGQDNGPVDSDVKAAGGAAPGGSALVMTFENAAALIDYVHKFLDDKKNGAAAIRNMWATVRDAKNELLDQEQNDSLTADKEAAIRGRGK